MKPSPRAACERARNTLELVSYVVFPFEVVLRPVQKPSVLQEEPEEVGCEGGAPGKRVSIPNSRTGSVSDPYCERITTGGTGVVQCRRRPTLHVNFAPELLRPLLALHGYALAELVVPGIGLRTANEEREDIVEVGVVDFYGDVAG